MDPSRLSPMLRHAIESFEHGVFHYLDGTDTGRKFALLHVDHTIELIVKEKLIRLGKSINKSDGKTLNIHEAFESISRVIDFPQRPRLEELHNLRNAVQHSGITVDAFAIQFFVSEAYGFVRQFLRDHLDVELEQYLPRRYGAEAMEARFVNAASDTIRASSITAEKEGGANIPLRGRLSGTTSMSIEPSNETETISVDPSVLGNDITGLSALIVRGTSAVDALILDGDIVILRQQDDVANGELAVVRITSRNEIMVKRVYREGGQVRLQPANPLKDPIFVSSDDVGVLGKVVLVIRKLQEAVR